MSTYHTPVLLNESIDLLEVGTEGVWVDATFGGGGHSREILSRLGANGKLMVFDKDTEALANLPEDKRIIPVHNNFRFVENFVKYYGFTDGVNGILADLGVSSHQFDTPERGFSFRFDAELDMRMNTSARRTAADLLNESPSEDIERILRLYGEVENSRKVASLICSARDKSPILTTTNLNEALAPATPVLAPHKFLAKVYQALRIEVNGEMNDLAQFLQGAAKSLKPDGVLCVITYHSLEDRLVKNFFRTGNIDGTEQKDVYGRKSTPFVVITKKPILPAECEIADNTRARSAKLRAIRKSTPSS